MCLCSAAVGLILCTVSREGVGALGWESRRSPGVLPPGDHCSSYWTLSKSGLLPVVTPECPDNSDLPWRVLFLISDLRLPHGSDNSVCPVFTDRTSCCNIKIPQWRCHTCQKVFTITLIKEHRLQGKLCFRNSTMAMQN